MLAPLGAAAQVPVGPPPAPPFHAQFGAAEAEACVAALAPGTSPIDCYDAFHDRLERVLPAVEAGVRARLAAEHGDNGPAAVAAFDDAQEAWGTSLFADLVFFSAIVAGGDPEDPEPEAEVEAGRVFGGLLVAGVGERIDRLVQRFGLTVGDLDADMLDAGRDIEAYIRPDRP